MSAVLDKSSVKMTCDTEATYAVDEVSQSAGLRLLHILVLGQYWAISMQSAASASKTGVALDSHATRAMYTFWYLMTAVLTRMIGKSCIGLMYIYIYIYDLCMMY